MKTDPERLLSEAGNADPFERELLASVHDVGPPGGARDRAWQGISAQIAAGALVGAAAGSSAAAAKAGLGSLATRALALKLTAIAAVGGIAAGGYVAFHAASVSVTPKTAPTLPRPSVLTAPPAPTVPEPTSVSSSAPSEETPKKRGDDAARKDQLTAESARLTAARAELRAGNPNGAQAILDRMQAQFPRGVLLQEREVLAIEVLALRGNAEGARARARAFVRTYPKSPHSEKLGRFLDGP